MASSLDVFIPRTANLPPQEFALGVQSVATRLIHQSSPAILVGTTSQRLKFYENVPPIGSAEKFYFLEFESFDVMVTMSTLFNSETPGYSSDDPWVYCSVEAGYARDNTEHTLMIATAIYLAERFKTGIMEIGFCWEDKLEIIPDAIIVPAKIIEILPIPPPNVSFREACNILVQDIYGSDEPE